MKLIRIALMMIRRTLLVVYDWGEVYIPPFKIPPGGEVDGGFGIEETFGCLHLLAFMSGTRKEEAKKITQRELFPIPLTVKTVISKILV